MDTISGLYTSAQEAIGASWAAATAEGGDTSMLDSEYLSANDSLQTVCTDSSQRSGDKDCLLYTSDAADE